MQVGMSPYKLSFLSHLCSESPLLISIVLNELINILDLVVDIFHAEILSHG